MQGPRLSSHYDRNVPDLTLHLAEHASPLPPPVKTPPSSTLPSLSPAARPASLSADDSIHSEPPPIPFSNLDSVSQIESEANQDEVERSKPSPNHGKSQQDIAAETLPEVGKGQNRDTEEGTGGGGDDDSDKNLNFQQRVWKLLKRHSAFVGPGVVASIAYLDPGNWSTDLQAGSAVSLFPHSRDKLGFCSYFSFFFLCTLFPESQLTRIIAIRFTVRIQSPIHRPPLRLDGAVLPDSRNSVRLRFGRR